jgi:flagellar biosynthesis/type III secretory pathway protein FliH
LAEIVKTVEEAVVKVVSKRFDFQLKQIDKSIRDNAEGTKQVRIDVGIV